jgi:hypothetical protein
MAKLTATPTSVTVMMIHSSRPKTRIIGPV